MDSRKFLLGTLAGGVTAFILGFLLYGVLLMDFFEVNSGSATGVSKADNMEWWAMIIGHLAMGAFYTYIFLQWAGIRTFVGGAKGGAIISLLVGLGTDLIMYGTSNLMNLTGTFVDVILWVVIGAITGGVVGWVLGTGEKGGS